MTDAQSAQRAVLELLNQRGTAKTICPSEAARALAGRSGNWRDAMNDVHKAVDALHASGHVQLSWKGKELDQRRGAYRIARR
ncbi:MAG: DUF3253 domain-containing protein [Erythrobacter sp.]|uniref:DUF3253 domain-containing protein n=1 Tax=Erythrobacter sp. TaxID=1042 RepID=UPI00261EDD4F|nr:DUF3253 domain-containing protein [Erythrobacter sp.]MDJ0979777.1 DUF3253 domain-containing protein [Erythrobacter sp.]